MDPTSKHVLNDTSGYFMANFELSLLCYFFCRDFLSVLFFYAFYNYVTTKRAPVELIGQSRYILISDFG